MIFEALFLAFTLGSESAERKTAAIKAKSMMNDQETMRREFFAKSRKWQEDMFTLFGTEQLASGKDFHWQEALEKLEFPVVLKAVDLMGSRGIFRCNTREETFFY